MYLLNSIYNAYQYGCAAQSRYQDSRSASIYTNIDLFIFFLIFCFTFLISFGVIQKTLNCIIVSLKVHYQIYGYICRYYLTDNLFRTLIHTQFNDIYTYSKIYQKCPFNGQYYYTSNKREYENTKRSAALRT